MITTGRSSSAFLVFCPGRCSHLAQVAQGLPIRLDQAGLLVGHADLGAVRLHNRLRLGQVRRRHAGEEVVLDLVVEPAERRGQQPPAAHVAGGYQLDLDARGYAELLRWASSPSAQLNERFPAALELFARFRDVDAEFADTIVRFWSGDPIGTPELRRRFREIGPARPVFSPVSARELGLQRIRFAAKLLAATGSAGWVILFDEVELIGRYSLQQRAKSYAEIARWTRGEHAGAPIAAVLAMTDDFEAAVITGKDDRVQVPAKLRAKDTTEAAELAAAAEAGMRIIEREMMLLTPPDAAELDQAYTRLKQLHAEAFGWLPPDVAGLERLGATRMRQYVRAWINEWDLVRLDPQYRPQTETVDIVSDYREDATLDDDSEGHTPA